MDPSTPFAVAKGAIYTSATTGLLGGLYGLFIGSGEASMLLATSAAINGGIGGATFFSIREYIVSPTLTATLSQTAYTRRLAELKERRSTSTHTGEKISWMDLRSYKLPDSAISGAISGGLLNSWKRGRAGILPGVTTGGIFCAILQLAYNEFGVARVKYVSRRLQDRQEAVSSPPSDAPSNTPRHVPASEPQQPFLENMLSKLGFEKLTDDAYLNKLKRSRDEHLRRIAELEREVEAETKVISSHESPTEKSSP